MSSIRTRTLRNYVSSLPAGGNSSALDADLRLRALGNSSALDLADETAATEGASSSTVMTPLGTRQEISALQALASPEIEGITPDTAEDSSAGINLFNIGKRRVSFGKGTWQADIEPWTGMVMEGAGKEGTIIEAFTTDFAIPFDGVNDVVFRDLTLRGQAALQFLTSARNVTLDNVRLDFARYGFATNINPASVAVSPDIVLSGLRVLNCELADIGQAGAKLPVVADGIWFIGNHLHDIEGGGRIVGGIQIGLDGNTPTEPEFASQRGVFIRQNFIQRINQTTKTGDSTPGNNYECFGIVVKGRMASIDGNVMEDIQGVAFDNEAIYTKCQQVNITGNLLRNAGATEGAINVKGNIQEEQVGDYSIVANNQIFFDEYNPDGVAVTRKGIHIATDKCICVNNLIDGANGDGIVVEGDTNGPTNFRDISVDENTVRNHLGQAGIRFRGGYDRMSASRNKISWGTVAASSGNFFGIGIVPASDRGTHQRNILFEDNIIEASSATLTLTGSATLVGYRVVAEYPVEVLKIAGGTVDLDPTLPGVAVVQTAGGTSNVIEDLSILDISAPGASGMSLSTSAPAKRLRIRHRFKRTTTNDTTASAVVIPVAEGSVLSVKTKATAASIAGTDSAFYERAALFSRYTSSDPVQVGATAALTTIEDVTGAWAHTFDINATTVRLRVNGDAAQTVNWVVTAEIETID